MCTPVCLDNEIFISHTIIHERQPQRNNNKTSGIIHINGSRGGPRDLPLLPPGLATGVNPYGRSWLRFENKFGLEWPEWQQSNGWSILESRVVKNSNFGQCWTLLRGCTNVSSETKSLLPTDKENWSVIVIASSLILGHPAARRINPPVHTRTALCAPLNSNNVHVMARKSRRSPEN